MLIYVKGNLSYEKTYICKKTFVGVREWIEEEVCSEKTLQNGKCTDLS